MKTDVPPPRSLVLAAALLAVPLIVSFALLVTNGEMTPVVGLLAGLVAVAGAVYLGRLYLRDVQEVADYVARLAEGERPPPPQPRSTALRILTASIGRLNRVLARRGEQAQIQLEANESMLDALHDPLLLIDSGRQVVRANQAARDLFGERTVNRDLAAALRNPDVLAAVDAVLAGAASRSVEFSVPVPVERMFETRVKPFESRRPAVAPDDDETPPPDGDERQRMVILTLHDITAIRRSEQMRADFVANASHELRTPLSSLLGFIETLRGPARDDAEARDRFLTIMHEQASRMSRLVMDLLSLSRIELDEHMPPSGRIDVRHCLEGVLAALELKAAGRRIRLALKAPPSLPAVVGDEDQLVQVFQNLVSNAIKYSREATEVTVAVSVTDGAVVGAGRPVSLPGRRQLRLGNRMVAIAVTDRGEGIARTHLPRLTERFYRVDAARSRALGGTGLGLAIVKHVVNRHRGRLTIESEVGAGSTFTVYLPVALDEPAKESGRGHAGETAA